MLNERVRDVNNTLDQLEHDRYMYELKLSGILEQDLMEECKGFREEHKEVMHRKVMECQKKKFEKLWHRKYCSSNTVPIVAKLVQVATQTRTNFEQCNLQQLKTNVGCKCFWHPLSTAQETVLAHGSNFAVTPKIPHTKNTLHQLR